MEETGRTLKNLGVLPQLMNSKIYSLKRPMELYQKVALYVKENMIAS